MMERTAKRGVLVWLFLATTVVIAALGLVNLNATSRGTETNMAMAQAIWLAVGLALVMLLAVLDYRIFDKLSYPFLGLMLVLLLLVLAVGREIKGSQRWLQFGSFNFQPSEVVKVAVVLALAKFFNDEPKWPMGGYTLRQLINPSSIAYPLGALVGVLIFYDKLPSPTWGMLGAGAAAIWAAGCMLYRIRKGIRGLHSILSPVVLMIVPALLILRQPDLGTTLIVFAVAGSMILFVKVRFVSLLIALTALVGVGVGAYQFLLEPYQRDRVTAFWNPETESADKTYHSMQSQIAVGSGGLSGKGYMKSTQTQFKFLPEQHTDFVFSVWAEEWGFWGSLGVLALYLFWLAQMINIASMGKDRFGVLIAIGVTALLFWHTFINIGMVIGLLPVVGTTMPLWSYGGSSVMSSMLGIGFLVSIGIRNQ